MAAPVLTAEPLSGVRAEPVRWLWEPYVPRGRLVLLDGDPGVGKSFLSVDLAARLSRGGPMPDGRPSGRPHEVLILSAEDQNTDTIRVRAEAAGADLDRVRSAGAIGGADVRFPRDLEALAGLIAETRADLTVIDPLVAFLDSEIVVNTYQGARRALARLAAVAADTDCTILMIRHLRKAGADRALHRGLGSVGIIGAVRVGLLAAPVPAHPSLHVLAVTKTNLARTPTALGYRLRQDEHGRGLIEWTGPMPCTADDLGTTGPRILWPRDRAADWLLHQLARGPMPAADVLKAAAAVSIPERTLRRAKKLASVRAYEVMLKGGRRVWYWFDPAAPWPDGLPFPRPDDLPPMPYSY